MKYDLAFGHSVAVRKAFLDTYNGNIIVFTQDTLEKFDYPPYLGDPELIEMTKQVIKRQTGEEYKHIILTNGATGAINIVLSVYQMAGYKYCVTRRGPYYMRYPTMVKSAGLEHITEDDNQRMLETVALLDYPSNPLNFITEIAVPGTPTVLDAVYMSNVYMNCASYQLPRHAIMVASYSKLTGLNGMRIGWIALNDDMMYERLKVFTTATYCGLARADSIIAKQLLYGFDWSTFETRARNSLNMNREEIAKLEKFLGDKPVEDKGMFHYAHMDKKSQELFTKAGVIWTRGSDLGAEDCFGRLNIGQDCQLIKEAVKSVLKMDQIRT
jgi:aspartate/methionine/tyrosine aminotransferase